MNFSKEYCIQGTNPTIMCCDSYHYDYGTGISSQKRTKLRDWAVWQARAGYYSQAALSSNDSKMLYAWSVVKTRMQHFFLNSTLVGRWAGLKDTQNLDRPRYDSHS